MYWYVWCMYVEAASEKYRAPDGRLIEIRNVWAHNLETEMVIIRDLVEEYPYVAMVRQMDKPGRSNLNRGYATAVQRCVHSFCVTLVLYSVMNETIIVNFAPLPFDFCTINSSHASNPSKFVPRRSNLDPYSSVVYLQCSTSGFRPKFSPHFISRWVVCMVHALSCVMTASVRSANTAVR